MGEAKGPTGPDLAIGIPLADLRDGVSLVGHVGDENVLVVKSGDDVHAIGATCTHYGGPLGDGLVVGTTVRCPWHHACFDLRSGEAIAAPALAAVPCWRVEREGGLVKITRKIEPADKTMRGRSPDVVIVGAGAAGHACADMLRREGAFGKIVMIGNEDPVDRPNLSKDYLAGTAPEEWMPLPEVVAVERVSAKVEKIDGVGKEVVLEDGRSFRFDACLIATGADPVRLPIPGAERAHVLRTLADSRAIIAGAHDRVVVIGASFIGLEVAASLRARNLEVDVVAPEDVPLARVLGAELGGFIKTLHEQHGVRFHLGRTAKEITADAVILDDGTSLPAQLVVTGVGVKPRLALAQAAGCTIDRGVVVDGELRTGVPGLWAAGDIARFPHEGASIRVEHWVVAQRQGQAVARSMLGLPPLRDVMVPFFWSQHYDVQINYVGHAESLDEIEVHGSIADKDCVIAYREGGKVRAVASIGRDVDSLAIEAALAVDDQAAVVRLLGAS